MLLFSKHDDLPARLAVLAGASLNLVVTLILFLVAARISNIMSETLAVIVTKVFGIILAALAAQFTIDGIKSAFNI
jgi:multiple antibiotic resistance protein